MSMKAIRIHQYGGPHLLQYEDVPIPKIRRGEVLVQVHAAGVNPVDYKHASGSLEQFFSFHPPWIPGRDFSGVIRKIGPDVTNFKVGDAVFGNCASCYAELVVVQANRIVFKPNNLTHLEAASIPVAAQTAWEALFDHGHLQAGQTVLIHAAAGGVGTFAVQFAHRKKARVLATASSSNKEYLQTLGADVVIDYQTTLFESVAKDTDLVIEMVGSEIQERSFGCLKEGGRLIATTQEPSQEQADKYGIYATMMHTKGSESLLKKITDMINTGTIKTEVARSYPLSRASDAWTYVMTKHVRGKVVLEVAPST
jgi:NADPH:quinone reductase-like Zn-dependent oxidoreductase